MKVVLKSCVLASVMGIALTANVAFADSLLQQVQGIQSTVAGDKNTADQQAQAVESATTALAAAVAMLALQNAVNDANNKDQTAHMLATIAGMMNDPNLSQIQGALQPIDQSMEAADQDENTASAEAPSGN